MPHDPAVITDKLIINYQILDILNLLIILTSGVVSINKELPFITMISYARLKLNLSKVYLSLKCSKLGIVNPFDIKNPCLRCPPCPVQRVWLVEKVKHKAKEK